RPPQIAEAHGAPIDGFLVCPHRPDEACACRKPKPGLLLQAERDSRVDLATAYMVGEQASDALAGLAAGCTPILLGDEAPDVTGSLRARSLDDAVNLILAAGRDSWEPLFCAVARGRGFGASWVTARSRLLRCSA